MKNMVMICAVCIFLSLTASAKAGTITQDFESVGASLGEGGNLTTQLTGLTFTGAYIAEKGWNIYAYWAGTGYGTDGAYSGSYSITDVIVDGGTFGSPSSPVSVSFSTPVNDLSFYAMDIDGTGTYAETLTASVYDNSSNLLQTITITSNLNDPDTGDGIATPVAFTVNNISSLTVTISNQAGSAAWALDDLSYTPVPIPAAVWLLGSGLIGLVAVRRKHNNMS